MDDFAFPDEETIIKMKREYDKALRTAKSVSALSTAKRTTTAPRCYFLTTLIFALTINRIFSR